MLVSSFAHCTAVLLFQLWQVQTFSPISACPASCTCDKTLLVNCSSLALPKAPSHIPATATALDLSHNALQTLAPLASGHMYLRGLQHLWVGNNSLESLSMCWRIQGNMGTRTLTRRNQKCVSWTPDLELLSADRNQLKCLPKGLGKMKSLKVLKLSHNRISKIGPADLTGCTHLNELHLQYNLINMIHPKAFEDLPNLKVLDVSHNLLVTIPVQAYLSLRNMNLLVDISGNRWKCDCSLKTIRRWLSVDDELDNFPTWKIMCFSPHHHAGKDLLYLEESELTCPQPVYSSPGVRKEVTVGEGIDIILSCSTANQDFLHTRWWTPHGHISDSQKFLHITNITENDAGLYVCVSGYHEEHVSVFSLHVHRGAHARRLRREAQIGLVEFNAEDNHNIKRNVPAVRNVQQSQFDLAVCLSVIITFIVAFILGVILRPFLEKWYKQIRNKKKSTTSPPNSQTAQSPYVNEGYSDTDDQEQAVYEGPRVTFGGVTEIHEQGSVPYYVTVEGSPPESNIDDAALQVQADRVLVKNIGVHKEVPLREENNEMTSIGSTDMQFENIPDPEDAAELEERSISPASFFSDEQQDSQMSHEGKESIEQRVLASTDKGETIPGFITDPFPLKMSETKEESVDELDPDLWNDSGESFSFTEGSQRSSSPASHVASFGHPLFEKQMSVDEPSDRPNSYNLGESGESKVGYTVNSEDIKDFSSEDNILTDDQKTDKGNRLRQDTITLDPTDIRMTYIRGDSLDDEPFTGYKEYFPFSNISTVFEEPAQYNVHPVYRTSLKTTNLLGEEMISESDRSHVGFSLDDSIFGVIDQTLDPITRIKQYIHFSQSQSYPQIQAPCYSTKEEIIPNKVIKTELKKISAENNFFVQIDASLDDLPKVKQYIQFSPSGSQLSTSAAPINQVATSVVVSKPESMSDTINIFYEGQTTPLPAMPKVQRYVLFSQSEPQTVHEHTLNVQEESFFGQVPISFDEVPKIKQHVQFSPSDLQHSTDSTLSESVHKVSRPVVVSKTDYPSDTISISYKGQNISLQTMPEVPRYVQFRQSDPQSVIRHTSTIQGDSLFEQIPISIDKLAKVKRYVEFAPFKSQLPNDPVYSESIHQVARPVVVSKTELPSDKISIFYKGQNIAIQTMPKVQRHVQFRESGPQMVHGHTPDIQGNWFFGRIPITFDEVPKVKHYVQFSPFKSQLPNDSGNSESIHGVARPVVRSKMELPSDTISIFYKGQNIAIQTMPKVQRYVQFRQSEPQTVQEWTPAIQGSSFFEQIPISFDKVPKIKQYVQFSPSESQVSTDTVHHYITSPEMFSKTESSSGTINIFYEGQTISLPAMAKVQRYVQFRQFKPQTVHEHTPEIQANWFFGQIPIVVGDVPKVKRHILFSQSTQTSLPYSPSKKKKSLNDEQITHEIKTPLVTSKPQNSGDNFFVQTGTCLDRVPKVKRYIQFTQSKVIPKTHNVLSKLNKTTQEDIVVKRNKPLSNYDDPVNKHIFFKQTGVIFDGIPKVKRIIQFTEHPPQPPESQPLSLLEQPVTPALILHAKPSQSKPNFFEISLENIPKVNRSLQFIQVEAEPSNQPIPSLSGKIHTSFDKVPKVKRYLQFINSETQPSSLPPLPSKITDTVTPAFSTKTQTTRSEEKGCSTIKEDDFFGQTVSTFNELPKVKRYIQFTQAQPRLPPSPMHSLSNRANKIIHARPELMVKDSTSVDYIQPAAGEQNILGPIGASFEVPKVRKYIQFSQGQTQTPIEKMTEKAPLFTQSEYQRQTAGDTSSNDTNTAFGSLDVSFNQLPNVKRNVQSEPYLSTEEVFKLSTKKNDLFGQTDGVPKLIRYRQHMESKPYNQSPSLSPKRKMMDVEVTESRMFTTSVTPETTKDFSWIQEAPSAVKVTTETSRLHQRPQLLLNADVYNQPAVEEVFIPTSSDKKYANTQGLDNRSTSESKLFSLGASSHESSALQTRKPLFLDHELQDLSQYITDKPAAFSEKDAREYLRESSLARQRQERRKMLFQQKKRAMDGFSLTSESFTSYESDQ
ncbi:Leucine-rich repeat-containing protein 66 [Bagarius yarrelli]|uniref:Leucine-rich repeat-containing protein 66 n=1 Tax=Bagarius yarrelli TaxID=175774 RepID=A0A556U7A8_BAGYA|nr:Leucine-rich repeat-containing protein 66 [Bagarius yarrelli]